MAKISALDVATALTGDEHLPIVQGTDTKRATLAAFRDLITPFLQYWYKGDPGDTGPADNTYTSHAALLASDPTRKVARLVDDAIEPDGNFSWRAGQWRRQSARGISFQAAGSATIRSAEDKARDTVSVLDFREAPDLDDTAAFERAAQAATRIHAPAGMGRGPFGAYIVDNALLPPATLIYGDGIGATVIRPPAGVEAGVGARTHSIFFANSGSPFATVDDIGLRDLTLHGRVEEEGFLEHCHLIELQGVRRFLAERVGFTGFRGDAIIFEGQEIDYANGALSARHNVDIVVRDCTFDGINNNNRNAVSIVDGVNVLVESCTFRRCTKSGSPVINGDGTPVTPLDRMDPNTGVPMPGAIDIEPNPYPFYIIQNITIRRCTFDTIGGNFGQIGIFAPAEVEFLFADIRILDCDFRNSVQSGTGADILINANRDLDASVVNQAVLVHGCTGSNGNAPFAIRSARGVTIDETNRWEDYAYAATLGYLGATDHVYDHRIRPTLVRVGGQAPAQFGLVIFNAVDCDIAPRAIDCGNGTANAAAIALLTGTSSRLRLAGARVTSPTGRTTKAIFSDGHIQSPGTNQLGLNDMSGLPSDFVAYSPGSVLEATHPWVPPAVTRVDAALATFTVLGAAVGDTVVASYSEDLNLVHFMTVRVREPNTVLIGIHTTTDSNIQPPAGTVRIRVTKQ